MSGEKILDETIEFVKFYKEYFNYPLYSDEVTITSSVEAESNDKRETSNIKRETSNVKGQTSNETQADGIPKVLQPLSKSDHNQDDITKEVAPLEVKKPLLVDESWEQKWKDCKTFSAFGEAISDCPKCKLLARTRKQVVFGTGNPNADIVVVGEAPGADEDVQGKPFVGRAGKLLTDILAAINLSREEIFICNILKCRPPDNRNPLPDEIENCEPYLFKQLEMIKPKMILAVGTFAAQTLLQTKEPLGRLRGKFHTYKGVKMMVTYHPAALLRNPNWKRPTWEDVQLFRKEYDGMNVK